MTGVERSGATAPDHGTGTITFAVPDLEEPYFAELTAMLVRRAEARGYSVVIQQTAGSHEREVGIVNGGEGSGTDGLIHVPRSLTVADLTRRRSPAPLVLLGEHIEASPFAHVTIDNRMAARAATEHLIRRGCRRLATVGPRTRDVSDAANRRHEGFLDALAHNGLDQREAAVAPVSAFTPAEGLRAMRELLETGAVPDGVVASNDSVAIGVLSALHEAGLRVPADVAVIGMDDIIGARYCVPSLTTVAPDKQAMVERALDVLERQIHAHPAADPPVEQIAIGFELIERDSTG